MKTLALPRPTVTLALVLLACYTRVVLASETDFPVTLVAGNWVEGEVSSQPALAGKAALVAPFGVDFDVHGNMYIVELSGGRVYQLAAGGQLQTISGQANVTGYEGDAGPARRATFNGMHNVAVSRQGQVFIADSWNHCVRQIDLATGEIHTMAGTGQAGV